MLLLEAGGYHTPLKVVRRHQHGHMTYPTGTGRKPSSDLLEII